jgi:hypothetical protein
MSSLRTMCKVHVGGDNRNDRAGINHSSDTRRAQNVGTVSWISLNEAETIRVLHPKSSAVAHRGLMSTVK